MEKNKKIELQNVPNAQIQQDSITNERRFLKLLFDKKSTLENALASGITFEYFLNYQLGQIFGCMAKYYNDFNALLQADTYESILRTRLQTPEEVGKWMEEYHQIVRQIVDENDYEYLRKSLCDNHVHRYGYTIAQTYLSQFLSAKSDQAKLVGEFQQEVANIGLPNDTNKIKHVSLNDALDNLKIELKDRSDHPEKYIGIKTGFDEVDKSFLGFQPGHYIVIAGVPNGGKTTLMFNLAKNMAEQKLNTVYVTVESDTSGCTRRFLSIESAINYSVIMRGGKEVDGLNDTTMGEFDKAIDRMREKTAPYFHWIEIPYKTPWSQVQSRLRQLMSYAKIDVLFVDYLNCLGREISVVGRPDLELADVSSKVQNFGKNNKILTFTAQQMKTDKIRELSKKPEASKDFRPSIGDMSGTKEIESDADVIFAVWIDQEHKKTMYLRSTKSRFSRSQENFSLAYDGDSGRVYNMQSTDAFGNAAATLENNPVLIKAVAAKQMTTDEVSAVNLWGDPAE